MKELLDHIIHAHGGIEKWNQFNEINAHVNIGGLTWKLKGQEGVLNDVNVRAALHQQYVSYVPFGAPDLKSAFDASRVSIETLNGDVIEEMLDPRASFSGHTRETQWNKLQLVYFASYAMWTYLTLPFNFTLPGFKSEEITPWKENGETWRRLEVTFPDYIETHSKRQIFYYGEDGLLRRHDYQAVVLGGLPAAHYVYDYKNFSGIMLPTRRRVFSLNEDNSYKPFVTIDIINATFK
jgi:hypothetical protein